MKKKTEDDHQHFKPINLLCCKNSLLKANKNEISITLSCINDVGEKKNIKPAKINKFQTINGKQVS